MDERELRRLAADRPLRTRELHRPNAFYGNAATLKRFAGLPLRTSLKAAVEHSIPLSDRIWDADLRTTMPVFLCGSAKRAKLFERGARGGGVGIPIGPMLAYATPERPVRPGRRLLAFPAHSTHHVEADYDGDVFARRVEETASGFDSITVCLYWKEVLRGMGEPYLRRGFECVTAGHMYDGSFLQRLRIYLDEASAVITNEVGSHLFFAVDLGLPVAVVRQPVSYRYDISRVVEEDLAADQQYLPYRRVHALFGDEIEQPGSEARSYVRDLIGSEHVRDATEMRTILTEAEARFRLENGAGDRAVLQLKGVAREAQATLERIRNGT